MRHIFEYEKEEIQIEIRMKTNQLFQIQDARGLRTEAVFDNRR